MSEIMTNGAFLLCGGLTCACAFLVVWTQKVFPAAVSLFFSLVGVAIMYLLLGADFLSLIQLLIYAGGILVLLIFGIFLTSRIEGNERDDRISGLRRWCGVVFSLGFFISLALAILRVPWQTENQLAKPTTETIGTLLLTKYLLPFEMISVLLLFALVGAIYLVRKEMGGKA